MTKASEITVAVVITAIVVAIATAILVKDDGPSPSPTPTSPPTTPTPPPYTTNEIQPVLAQGAGVCSVKTWPFSAYVDTRVSEGKLTVRFNSACGTVQSLKLTRFQRMCVPKPVASPSPGPSPTPQCTPAPAECFEPGCAQPADVTCAAGASANTFVCDMKPVHPGFYRYRAEVKVSTSPNPLLPEPVIEIGDW